MPFFYFIILNAKISDSEILAFNVAFFEKNAIFSILYNLNFFKKNFGFKIQIFLANTNLLIYNMLYLLKNLT